MAYSSHKLKLNNIYYALRLIYVDTSFPHGSDIRLTVCLALESRLRISTFILYASYERV